MCHQTLAWICSLCWPSCACRAVGKQHAWLLAEPDTTCSVSSLSQRTHKAHWRRLQQQLLWLGQTLKDPAPLNHQLKMPYGVQAGSMFDYGIIKQADQLRLALWLEVVTPNRLSLPANILPTPKAISLCFLAQVCLVPSACSYCLVCSQLLSMLMVISCASWSRSAMSQVLPPAAILYAHRR